MALESLVRHSDEPVATYCCSKHVRDLVRTYLGGSTISECCTLSLSLTGYLACLKTISRTAAVISLLEIILDFCFEAQIINKHVMSIACC